jgi:EAL domain-containing protein (putative c-di-GMP-specific phosphodiesterase class I)/GGDEF domain-containing protein
VNGQGKFGTRQLPSTLMAVDTPNPPKSKTSIYYWIEERSRGFRIATVLLVLLTLALGTFIVYNTGGSYVVYTHNMYVPVVIAGLVFGLRGGLVAALSAGLLLGPLMPLNVASGELQSIANWVYRLAYFLLVGVIVGSSSDLIRNYIKRLRWHWLHNHVSELPNRDSLLVTLQRLMSSHKEFTGARPFSACLYLIDITNLNELSLKLGPNIEKAAILALVQKLDSQLQPGELIHHIRTNRLVILANHGNVPRHQEVRRIVENCIASPIEFEEIPLLLHCVWSDIEIDDLKLDPQDYLRRLEMAANEARVRRIQHSHYSRSLGLKSRENLAVLGLLKHAFDDRILQLRYQPKYRLSDRKIVSVEALMHWNDPNRGVVPASQFLPLAEESALITPMTLWVLEQAVRDFLLLKESASNDFQSVAVNISATNLGQESFVESVDRLLTATGIPAACLELELTESGVLSDLDTAVARLNQITDLGIRLSIDDFGTGFSSLQYLERFPVSTVKIDRLFVSGMTDGKSNHCIVKSTIDLAHTLGLDVVAEGIETEQVEQALREMGCDYGQGFYFSRPIAVELLRLMLNENSKAVEEGA